MSSKSKRAASMHAEAAAAAEAGSLSFAASQSESHSPWPKIDKQAIAARRVLDDKLDANTIRFLFATDNHVGYSEHDPIRGNDSFLSFEECLYIAEIHDVDFIVLGGDLFHENKPSRPCLYRTMNLLREYCFGDKPVPFDIVSDQARNFPSNGSVNFTDPNCNVSLPVFIIHGNHDDPAGLGSYSAIDLLASCRLVNYFGKAERVDHILIYPILLHKANTRMALYGLGNIRDERLHRTFTASEVKWVRPDDSASANTGNEWFNVAVLHQNRVPHSFTDKNYISSTMLPNFLDMVFWAHEHECLMQEQSEEGEFVIVQPGSSVATSLSAGEAKDKHVALVEIQGDHFRLLSVPLGTVRPFAITDIRLSDGVEVNDSDPLAAIDEFLTDRVEQLIQSIKANPKFSNRDRPSLPLVRMRVEHTGFPRINVSKFGQKFVNQVANPDDILTFYKQFKSTKRAANTGPVTVDSEALTGAQILEETVPIQTILDAVSAHYPLSVLPESSFSEAIEEFVEKKSLTAITDFVEASIKKTTRAVKEEQMVKTAGTKVTKTEIDLLLKKHQQLINDSENRARVRTKVEGDVQREILEGLDLDAIDRMTKRGKGTTKATSGRGRGKKTDEMLDDDESEEEEYEEKKTALRRKPAASRAKPAPRSRAAKLEFAPADDGAMADDAIENDTAPLRRRSIDDEPTVSDHREEQAPTAPQRKQRRVVKQEASEPIQMGVRGKRGELNFLSASTGSARSRASAFSLPSQRAKSQSQARQRQIVDLIED